jgi:hypothetical protein
MNIDVLDLGLYNALVPSLTRGMDALAEESCPEVQDAISRFILIGRITFQDAAIEGMALHEFATRAPDHPFGGYPPGLREYTLDRK